jgi:hypothetical protein
MKRFRPAVAGWFLAAGTVLAAESVYDFTADTINGAPQNLSLYKGQVLLIAHFNSRTAPDSPELTSAIESALNGSGD